MDLHMRGVFASARVPGNALDVASDDGARLLGEYGTTFPAVLMHSPVFYSLCARRAIDRAKEIG